MSATTTKEWKTGNETERAGSEQNGHAPERVRPAPVLVLGGTGKTGRRVVRRLAGRGVPVRVGSRAAETPFDWEDPGTWEAVLQGVGSVYVSYYPDLAVPGAVESVGALVAKAAEHGASRLVLLAGRNEEEADRAEQVVRDSGIPWTILRPSWFSQNFSENYLLEAVVADEVVLPVHDIGEPFVDADDVADVAVAALTEDGHLGQIYELTGPRLLTFAEAVAEIGRAAGRDLRFVQTTPVEYAATLIAEGVPDDFVWLLNYLFTTVLDGRSAHTADGVQRAVGRPPKDFAEYARVTAATGVWAG